MGPYALGFVGGLDFTGESELIPELNDIALHYRSAQPTQRTSPIPGEIVAVKFRQIDRSHM